MKAMAKLKSSPTVQLMLTFLIALAIYVSLPLPDLLPTDIIVKAMGAFVGLMAALELLLFR